MAHAEVTITIEELDALLALRDRLTRAELAVDACQSDGDRARLLEDTAACAADYSVMFGKLTGASPRGR